ncbi:MAG: 1-hydroxycarotenoid 3,4-desaturase CrtD [Pseudomonadota bacterium]
MSEQSDMSVSIIGAGMGGLSAALTLASQNVQVTVFEKEDYAGGKIRQIQSSVGLIDTGPTVVTMRPVFEQLFRNSGAELTDYVELKQHDLLARHFWSDGTQLDLFTNTQRNKREIARVFGSQAMHDYERFETETAALFDAFEIPVMQSTKIDLKQVVLNTLRTPKIWPAMRHGSLDGYLSARFSEPRLRQLFGRYATYVGGSPLKSPALLALIWQAERRGVWSIKGGVGALATAIQTRAEELGARFHFSAPVKEIQIENQRAVGLKTENGTFHRADAVLFNGDPCALARAALGQSAATAVAEKPLRKRSLSANVWAFAADPGDFPLAHHNVFFADRANSEFGEIANGQHPTDPTLYVCAQDFDHTRAKGPQRFEIIMNAPAGAHHRPDEDILCHHLCFQRLQTFGLHLKPPDLKDSLITPKIFAQRYPESSGSLYGQTPHGMMASFRRPTIRSRIPNLYLAGGGVHPGPGIPMACLSGQHAGAAMIKDQTLRSKFHQMDMPGGISMESQIAAPMQSR